MGKVIRVIVTGHNGFLGSNLVNFLKKDKRYEVKTVDRVKDLRDLNNVMSATRDTDWVFHMAADMGGIGYFTTANYYPPINNFLMDINILQACEKNKVKRLFYPASACAYPVNAMNEGIRLRESMLEGMANPDQMYGWEKLTMLKLMKYSPVSCRVGVLHTIYGEGQAFSGRKAKFPPQIAYKALQAVKTNKIIIWGDGTQTRTFLYVKDAVKKIMAVMENEKYDGPVNIGSEKDVSVNEVVKLCCKILEISPQITQDKSKPTGPTRRRCNNDKYNKLYGKPSETSLKAGFTRIINYIKKNATL